MDFPNQLVGFVNDLNLPIKMKLGYLDTGESFVMYPLPGSRVIDEFMDGTTDQQLNFEVAMKSKSQSKTHDVLWEVQSRLELMNDLQSDDGSFDFHKLEITNKPFINQLDNQNWYVFLLDFQVELTIYNEGEK